MTLIRNMHEAAATGRVPGECAKCAKPVFEELWLLDDAYNVWMGRCPHCAALNYLSMTHGLRGYTEKQMHLVLPTDEEVADNHLPAGTPTRGPGGKTAPLGSLESVIRDAISKELAP